MGIALSAGHSAHALNIRSPQGSSGNIFPKIHPPPYSCEHAHYSALLQHRAGSPAAHSLVTAFSALWCLLAQGCRCQNRDESAYCTTTVQGICVEVFVGTGECSKPADNTTGQSETVRFRFPESRELVSSEQPKQLGNHIVSTFHVKHTLWPQSQ